MSTLTAIEKSKRCIFFDMKHSNSAARIRLWLQIKGISEDIVETRMTTSADLDSPEFLKVNPLKKVPAFITDQGLPLFESSIIMGYLEDRFSTREPRLLLDTPDDRALVALVVRCHDLYVASANCTQPNFSSTQGALYLDPTPTEFTPARRTMNAKTRAANVAELYKQLCWLDKTSTCAPYLVGDRITHADLTWYPTMVMIQFLVPRSIGWPTDFLARQFPKLDQWYSHCTNLSNQYHAQFAKIRDAILEENLKEYNKGWLKGVKEDVESHPEYIWNYID
jgi:glutathione S-transferase